MFEDERPDQSEIEMAETYLGVDVLLKRRSVPPSRVSYEGVLGRSEVSSGFETSLRSS